MKTTMIVLALFLGLAAGGAALLPGGQAHAADQSSFVKHDGGGGANG